jgi:hypothetical protein
MLGFQEYYCCSFLLLKFFIVVIDEWFPSRLGFQEYYCCCSSPYWAFLAAMGWIVFIKALIPGTNCAVNMAIGTGLSKVGGPKPQKQTDERRQ